MRNHLAMLFLGVWLVSCGTRPVCDQSNCASGCCDSSGLCFAPANDSCGLGGSACVSCSFEETCRAGVCRLGSSGGGSAAGGGTQNGGGSVTGGGIATGGGTATGGGSVTGGGTSTGGGLATGGGSVTGGGATTGGGSVTGGGTSTGGGLATGGGSVTGGGSTTGGGSVTGGGTSTGGGFSTGGGSVAGGGTTTGGGFVNGGGAATGGGTTTGGGTATGGGTTTGGGSGTGGGTTLDAGTPCAILAASLASGITFDYLYQPSLVYVGLPGWPTPNCPGFRGQAGYNTAYTTPVFFDNGSTGIPVNTGASSSLTFLVGERVPNSLEVNDISRNTGIPVASLNRSGRILDGLANVSVSPTLPIGVTATWNDAQQAIVFNGPFAVLNSYAQSTLSLGAHVRVNMQFAISTASDPIFLVDFLVQTDHPPYVTPVAIMEP